MGWSSRFRTAWGRGGRSTCGSPRTPGDAPGIYPWPAYSSRRNRTPIPRGSGMAASASTLVVKDPELMYQLNPRKWEELIAGAYELAGFDEVILTPRSGDKGRDVIAVKKGIGCIRFLEEVKAYKPDH